MYKVLIAEDEMLVRLGLKNSINWEKYDMTVAGDVSNGKAALDFYYENRPDVIITDIKMPVMDGMELISRIRETDDKAKFVILTCMGEFDLVKKAMSLGVSDYILKLTMTEEELDKILSKIRNELDEQKKLHEKDTPGISNVDAVKDKLMKDFIFYNIYSGQEFLNRIQSMGISLKPGNLALAVMEIDNYDSVKAHFEDQKGYLIASALMNVIKEILDKNTSGVVFHEDGPRYVIIMNTNAACNGDAIPEDLSQQLDRIRESLKIYFNTSVSFGLSSIRSGFEPLREMYREAVSSLNMRFHNGQGIYHIQDSLFVPKVREKCLSLLNFYDLLGIQDENYKIEFEKKVHSLADNIPDQKDAVKDMMYQFLHWITDSMRLSGDDIYGLLISYGARIRNAEIMDLVLESISEFMTALKNLLKEKNILSTEISKALLYMKKNYVKELSLQEVAEHVNLSPSYFSSIFKKELNVNFIEYLNDIRISNAKELLRNTSMKSYEIAEKVGFKESTYFSVLFKKATGTSPNKFRQIWQKSWKGESEDEDI